MKKIKIDVLILPKFEIGEMFGDFPAEAQCYYEEYMMDSDKYILKNGKELYVNNELKIALGVTGSGKVNTSCYLTAVLCDERFDFSSAYILSTGCAGGAIGNTTLGDVTVVSSCVDQDLGHTADIREYENKDNEKLWFHNDSFDDISYKVLNAELVNNVFELVKDTNLSTTEISKDCMARNFPNQAWATREPKVIKGTVVTGDNFWKGDYCHKRALQICDYYKTPDPFTVSEMEDIAVAVVAEQFGLLDKVIAIRVACNLDVFIDGTTPESMWDNVQQFAENVKSNNDETLDIFVPSMKNVFLVGKKIIDAIINEKL